MKTPMTFATPAAAARAHRLHATLFASLAAVAALAAFISTPAKAADPAFPTKPLTLVIPFPPGGATDVLGRVIAQRMGQELGQPFVVENRAGAGTIIGAGYVSKAPADGYTLLLSSGTTFTVNPAIRSNLPYDPVQGFDPIGISGRTGLILLANQQVPVQSVKQFVDHVKAAAPGTYSYGSFGSGTTSHFAGETILQATGLKMTHVPYKGSAPAMTDLMGGQVPFTVDTVAAAIPQLKTGKIKAIAITTAKRSPLLPNVPTLAESGYPGIDMDTWLVMAAPKGLPPAVRARLEKALAATVADPETKAKLTAQGMEPAFSSGAAAAELIQRELPAMRAVAARSNITAD